MINSEREPENTIPDNSEFDTKEVGNVFDSNATEEYIPLPQDPSEILKRGRELIKPINEKLKQLKKEFQMLGGLSKDAYEKAKEELKQEREIIEEKIKQEIIERKKDA